VFKPNLSRLALAAVCATGVGATAIAADGAGPDHVSITWMSVTNIYYELGPLHILTDGYITRIPREEFYGGGGGYAFTHHPHRPDAAAVARVLDALGGPTSISLLLTGHSHWDHSFDTATWSQLTGAPIIGSKTTCLEAIAQGIPDDRCQPIYGGEKLETSEGVVVRVVRWNHSGDSNKNPEQHQPVELCSAPTPDAKTGGLRAGVAEDFPNGGGNRAFLFTVDSPGGRYSWFYQNSASPSDLAVSIIMDGNDFGAPLENLKAAMRDAGLDHVDLWIGTGGIAIAQLLAPVLKPKAYLPVHWDDFFAPFESGVTKPYADAELEAFLQQQKIQLLKPHQYMDKWRLDASGITPEPNEQVKRALGFSDAGTASR
jgi:L-ascorbate metabolism protein UlaG (beta-lactamase superfamily)